MARYKEPLIGRILWLSVCTIFILLIMALLGTCIGGCTSKIITLPNGAQYAVTRFLTKEQFNEVTYNPETQAFTVRQFSSNPSEIALTYLNMGLKLGTALSPVSP